MANLWVANVALVCVGAVIWAFFAIPLRDSTKPGETNPTYTLWEAPKVPGSYLNDPWAPRPMVAESGPLILGTPNGSAQPVAQVAKVEAPPAPKTVTIADQLADGQHTFATLCATCHRPDATGMPGVFPPLAKSDFLMADKQRAIGIVLNGLNGPVTVNGGTFNGVMPPLGGQLSDDQIANVLTFVRNSFGNKGEAVHADEVGSKRGGKPGGAQP